MAYCRWGTTDIYLFWNSSGVITCCNCKDLPTFTKAIEHVHEHQAIGQNVPEFVIEQLVADRNQYWDDVKKATLKEDEGR